MATATTQLAAATPANSNVTRTGYAENTLTNYKADNFKVYGGLYYKLAPTTTLSLIGNWGEASTVYQGTDRYSLKDVRIGQYKAEVAGKHFYVRAYTTQENAGNSYDMVAVATLLNEAYSPTGGATGWGATYVGTYAQAFGAALQGGATREQLILPPVRMQGRLRTRTGFSPALPPSIMPWTRSRSWRFLTAANSTTRLISMSATPCIISATRSNGWISPSALPPGNSS